MTVAIGPRLYGNLRRAPEPPNAFGLARRRDGATEGGFAGAFL